MSDEKEHPMRKYWCGEPIDEMPREKLLEIIDQLVLQLDGTRDLWRKSEEVHAVARRRLVVTQR